MAHKHTRHHKKRALPDFMTGADLQRIDVSNRRLARTRRHQVRARELGVTPYVSPHIADVQKHVERLKYLAETEGLWNVPVEKLDGTTD